MLLLPGNVWMMGVGAIVGALGIFTLLSAGKIMNGQPEAVAACARHFFVIAMLALVSICSLLVLLDTPLNHWGILYWFAIPFTLFVAIPIFVLAHLLRKLSVAPTQG